MKSSVSIWLMVLFVGWSVWFWMCCSSNECSSFRELGSNCGWSRMLVKSSKVLFSRFVRVSHWIEVLFCLLLAEMCVVMDLMTDVIFAVV